MTRVVIVPVRDQPKLTERFLVCMRGQAFDEILVLDNGCKRATSKILADAADADARLSIIEARGLGIYEMWNLGFSIAEQHEQPVSILVSNNDVELPPGALDRLDAALRSDEELWAVYPDYDARWTNTPRTHGMRRGRGVARDGGLYGPCFLVAADRLPWRPLISSPYEWWFGDNHLARQIEEEGGRHARLVGLPVLHANEGTARHHPETIAMRNRDRKRWLASQHRGSMGSTATRRQVPGTRVWAPGGKRIR